MTHRASVKGSGSTVEALAGFIRCKTMLPEKLLGDIRKSYGTAWRDSVP